MAYAFQKSYLILLTFGKRDDFPDHSSYKTPGARRDPMYFICKWNLEYFDCVHILNKMR